MKPGPFHLLDRIIHERARLAITSLLAATQEMHYTDLRDALGMTDGNLMAHLKTLQDAGYVLASKTPSPTRTLTSYSLSPLGRQAFSQYIELLDQILAETKRNIR